LAQGAQGSVKKNKKVYLSGDGVIGETCLPPQALSKTIIDMGITINKRIYLIACILSSHQFSSISNHDDIPQRNMTGWAIGNLAYKNR
jgi:hypothetical protein